MNIVHYLSFKFNFMRKSVTLLFILFTAEFLLAQCQFMSERDFEAVKYRLSVIVAISTPFNLQWI